LGPGVIDQPQRAGRGGPFLPSDNARCAMQKSTARNIHEALQERVSACGRGAGAKMAASWSAPARLEAPIRAYPSRCSATAIPRSRATLATTGSWCVWFFTRSGGVWSQQGNKLAGTGAVGAVVQGRSVALSGDGRTAIGAGIAIRCTSGRLGVFVQPALQVSPNRHRRLGNTRRDVLSYVVPISTDFHNRQRQDRRDSDLAKR
jgi:hypothetical protein